MPEIKCYFIDSRRRRAKEDEKISYTTSTGWARGSRKDDALGRHKQIILSPRDNNCTRPTDGRMSERRKFAPYVEVNSKISRVLRHDRPKDTCKVMHVSKLDEYYKLVTRETCAATILHSQCRRIMAAKRCEELALRRMKATMIQSMIRCYLARSQLLQLVAKRKWANGVRNQFIRVCVSRYRRRKIIALENDAAIICQCAIRIHFAKKRRRNFRLQFSWELNQCRWKALSIRLAWANRRLYCHARTIQCAVRRALAQRRVTHLHAVCAASSTCIQACWRRYVVRKQ